MVWNKPGQLPVGLTAPEPPVFHGSLGQWLYAWGKEQDHGWWWTSV